MKWKKNQSGGRKWYGKQQCLFLGTKSGRGDCPPCPIGFAAIVHAPTKAIDAVKRAEARAKKP